jgi:two-component system, NtrC family, sensor kinase
MTSSDRLILYVDDERSNRIVFEQTFKGRFAVKSVSSGAEALEVLKTDAVAVLVTDQRMPGMSGNDLLERAKQLHPDVVRVVITAYSDLDPILRAVNEGLVARYIIKPWDRSEVEQILAWAVEAHVVGQQNVELQLRLMQNERMATIGSIASAIIHDLGTPLSFIHGNIERLTDLAKAVPPLKSLMAKHAKELSKEDRERLQDLVEELPEMLKDMTQGADLLVEVTHSMRRLMQKPESEEAPSADPVAVIRFTMMLCHRLAMETRCKIQYDGPAALPQVRMSSTELTQTLINLVTNAANAQVERKRLGGYIVLTAVEDRDRVRFVVKDDGPGIPPDVLPKLGQPFFTTRAEGSGVGLTQCRRLIGKYGGELAIESKLGSGTTVSFSLEKA